MDDDIFNDSGDLNLDTSYGSNSRIDQLYSREAELRRLNDELEARKVEALKQAEEMVKQQDEALRKPLSPSRASPAPDKRPGAATAARRREAARTAAASSAGASSPKGKSKHAGGGSSDHGYGRSNAEVSHATNSRLATLEEKVQALTEQLEMYKGELSRKDEEMKDLEGTHKKLLESHKQLLRSKQQLQTDLEKQERESESVHSKARVADQNVVQLRKELTAVQRAKKQAEIESNGREVRLQRALQEIEKFKNRVQNVKTQGRDMSDSLRQENERLAEENKLLTRQKAELVTAFKKQLKLIDILKKQKIHIEAAKLLSFTEDEFAKTLELGQHL